MQWLAWAFLIAVAAETLTRLWLGSRQIAAVQAHRDEVPAPFRGQVALADQQKAADYTAARVRLGRWATVVEALVKLGFTLGGGLAAIDALWRHSGLAEPWRGACVVATLHAAAAVGRAALLPVEDIQDRGPLRVQSDLAAAVRRGFRRSNCCCRRCSAARCCWPRSPSWRVPASAVVDLGMADLAGVDLGPDLGGSRSSLRRSSIDSRRWPMRRSRSGSRPCSNAAGSRRAAACSSWTDRCARPTATRTSPGIGRNKRIVFFDTLLSRIEAPEIEAVLAHELGHFRLHHVRQRLVASVAADLRRLGAAGLAGAAARVLLVRWACRCRPPPWRCCCSY